ncbi:hypothetical protein PTTG_07156 [Puccinia triticina 1-1 BBBD Race 1]|uniref:Uncharacterized protein n=2 Tax=Puccinia triticina TaxID=208348 RepID=A0A0C4F235_PUCT1|nr:uncharacterized protein PtA15_15A242 [Puccinia triticina]OAV91230.1 hypothetical protein PTTG_07156 [Puccinia triticina 1-1 BBBD Race 1]WAQ91850.1 hypothetical protein PtA15_15A242 [Puccinia triticina]WAR62645.1 hypothetical protein PtB15_15B232 [Puccinia triticina]
MTANFAHDAEVNQFIRRVFIIPTLRRCREHGNHPELAIVIPLRNGQSMVYRIAENRRRYYLSVQRFDLRTHILPSRPSPSDGSRRPMWVADIDDDRIRLMLAARVESSLRAIEQSDAACSLAWVLHFIDGLRHTEFRAIQGRLRTLRRTLLLLAYFIIQSALHDL